MKYLSYIIQIVSNYICMKYKTIADHSIPFPLLYHFLEESRAKFLLDDTITSLTSSCPWFKGSGLSHAEQSLVLKQRPKRICTAAE